MVSVVAKYSTLMVVGSLLLMAAQTATAVPCSSVTGNDLTTLCARPNYTGAKITANTGSECTNNPCSGADADLCCKPATAKCNSITGSDVQTICAAPGYTGLNGEDTQTGNPTVATLTNEDPTVEIHT